MKNLLIKNNEESLQISGKDSEGNAVIKTTDCFGSASTKLNRNSAAQLINHLQDVFGIKEQL